ncbi:Gfo/Idh/MocA family oxidoreductase [Modestobacter sp. VKM Ac-2979]|uniref:Gfo/Idh/MocA family oxidoreductase n=1 Tax=unclassified Modestobacter TaxID=2643866 RepID=UPI0022AB6CF7|nr:MULTISPECIES: Gfo/Idh/MocA family oxidoreductase [unclassified Modestobacter]MCZ2810733.1 Gfo/Idh/MocA family oxidoreductase [Modestobacter sp. VKM Ac-2979]MCZ2840246.1 Gfo/Idh/MocA family oxidoreductase [Modestobacter sp. VKM Ac-2980]
MTTTDPSGAQAPRRYAVVGTGHRAEMYVAALLGSHADVGRLVALCDPNSTRMAYYQRQFAAAHPGSAPLPAYGPEDFDTMLDREQPDVVIVASVDFTHAEYISRALRAGRDVITEKPLTTDAAGCRTIVDAVDETGRDLVVTFNYRYSPRNAAVRRLVAEGAIGAVTSVHFEWVLDSVHGADYFRRWHRDKSLSGGLFVHKATHHFDLVNWWVGAVPETVFALGDLRFYGDANAKERGLGERPARSHGAPDAGRDPFALDLAGNDRLRQLYLEAEVEDGYIRDQDVFSPGITIEDNMALLLRYADGPVLSYSLNAHGPWEGYRVSINGTEGRIELSVVERAAVVAADDVIGGFGVAVDPSATPEEVQAASGARSEGTELVLQRRWAAAQRIEVPEGPGAHGGGDALLLDDLFRPGTRSDPLGQAAGWLDGVRSVLVGAAANQSLTTGQVVHLADYGIPLRPEAAAAPAGSTR